MKVSLKEIGDRLGVSVATVSRALHRDSKVRGSTAERVRAALAEAGYRLDPVVSAGMSRIRQRSFYRETLAWCGDSPRGELPWLADLFRSVEDYGARLGYGVEYFRIVRGTPRELGRLASVWRARGIRGVLLGPFRRGRAELPFPSWEGFSWVSIGHSPGGGVLHEVGRDYASDIDTALEWLAGRGCRRPGFVLDPGVGHLFRRPLLQAALLRRHGEGGRGGGEPFCELDPERPEAFARWLGARRPDGVILPRALREPLREMTAALDGLPRVLLSPPDRADARGTPHFVARYEVIGQAAVNLLHRLLSNREFGPPAYRQTVALSSIWSDG